MTVEQVALFAETIAAIAVLLSVIYLSYQVRDSSRSNRAAAVATLLAQYDSPNSVVAADTETARVFRLGFELPDQLSEDEGVQFRALCLQYLTVYHTAFRFHHDGILGNQHWDIFRRDLVEFTDYPGLQALREYFLAYYSPDSEFHAELLTIFDERHDSEGDSTFFGR